MDLPAEPASLYLYAELVAAAGYRRLAGVDEAGRGPLAGPVVVAAVILPPAYRLDGLNDSKQLTPRQRERLYARLTGDAGIVIGLVVAGAEEVDRVNIYQATLAGMRQAARQVDPDYILVDGSPVRDLPAPGRNVIKGDARCASIAAASIIAKVHRDRLMTEYDAQYPGYGFARHKGYGTPQHLEALGRLGPCPIHRRSFAPVANLLAGRPRQPSLPL